MAKLREPDRLPVEAIQFKERIAKDSASYPGGQCRRCDGRDFQKHGKRWRWFLPVIRGLVVPILSVLWRWRCVRCGTSLTHYPALCVPRKRYLRPEVEHRADRYLKEPQSGYRQVVHNGAAAVVYEQGPLPEAEASAAEKEREQVRSLAPSTVHRWIGAIAACGGTWQRVVQQAQELGGCFLGSSPPIPAWKYRRAARRRVLEACGRLLSALQRLTVKTSPEFATLGSSP